MMCGTPVAARPSPEQTRRRAQADPETVRFVRAVISRPATFTFIFLVANVFLYLLMWLSGGATGQILLAYGAKLNYLIDYESQWWRFVTPIFLHVQLPGMGLLVGNLHLLSNMYGLFMLGPYVEKLYGSARFVVFWVLTGVAGVVASYLTVRPGWAKGALGQYLFKQYDSPSAGASGALFGLMGVLFVFGTSCPRGLRARSGRGCCRRSSSTSSSATSRAASSTTRRTSADYSRGWGWRSWSATSGPARAARWRTRGTRRRSPASCSSRSAS
jgi:membrane associated rhomboid family serine protease